MSGKGSARGAIVRRRWQRPCDLVALATGQPTRYPCLLESVAHGTSTSRWDVLLAFPAEQWVLPVAGPVQHNGVAIGSDDFLATLDAAWRAERCPPAADELPFHGGWALYLGYELAARIESRLRLPAAPGAAPTAMAVRCPAAIVRDHARDETWMLAEPGQEALLEAMAWDLEQSAPVSAPMPARQALQEEDPQRFLQAVAQAREHLAAGDIFQANLSRLWQVDFAAAPAPAALYHALRKANPAPFAALWQQPGWAVVSSSPERLVSRRGDIVQTRPIAGTRPRRPGEDAAARIQELVAHPKEQAEHVMLVDMERNDLGRICVPGSVRVDELMAVESYAHVHHLVSNIRGRVRAAVSPGELIAAVFPGGTITGCPKVRCMQVIAELEGVGRGAYTGAVGYLDRSGDLDLNILIRTLEVAGTQARFRAGAGIVIDSVAASELEETRAKARGLVRALEAGDVLAPAYQRQA